MARGSAHANPRHNPKWRCASLPAHPAKEAAIGFARAALGSWLGVQAAWLTLTRQRVRIDGQTLDAHIQALLRLFATQRQRPPGGVAQTRELYAKGLTLFGASVDPTVRATPLTVAGALPARLYRPAGAGRGLLVYFHGGGWLMGDLDTHDRLCRRLAARSGHKILSVAYRLAPEHPYPAAFDDARAAFAWSRENADLLGIEPGRIAVGGDSAGGNLAAAVAIAEAAAGRPGPCGHLLLYPALDLVADPPPRSAELFATGFLLTRAMAEACVVAYAPDGANRADPRLSPLRAPNTVTARLSPGVVITAGFDPLRDQGLAWAKALGRAGVAVTSLHEAALIHGFADFAGLIPAADAALNRAGRALADMLRSAA